MSKNRGSRFSVFLILIFWIFHIHGLGLKIIKQFPDGLLLEAMPWQIDTYEGWLYVASDDGLIQYDGNFPEIFTLNNNRPLRSVSVDKEEGKIFVGGISEFGYFYPSPEKSLEYVCISDSVGENKNIGNIWGIYHKDGIVYVQGDRAVIKYDLNSGKHYIVNSDYKLDTSHLIGDILWFGTDDGLKFLLGSNIVDAPGVEQLRNKRIREILEYKNGYLLITSDGVWQYENNKLEKLSLVDKALKELGEIFSADLDDNTLALGSVAKGIGVIDLRSGVTKIYDEARGLPSNTIISLKFNEDGNLLAGLQYGMAEIMLNQPVERIDNSVIPIGSGYIMAEYKNKLFLGTNRGLYEIPINGYKERMGSQYKYYDDLQGQVWGLTNIDGDLFCSHDRGLFLIKEDGRTEKIGEISGVWDIQKMIGNPGKAYVGTYSGLFLLEKKNDKWGVKSQIDGFESSMFNFAQEKADIIWTDNAENGMVRLSIDTANNKFKNIENFKFTEDGYPLTSNMYVVRIDNDIYITTSNGIYIYDNKLGEIKQERDFSRLLDHPQIVRRLKKVNGSIFALTDKELLEADPAGILDMTRIQLEPSLSKPVHEKDIFFPIGNDYIGYPTKNGYLIFDYTDRQDSFWNKKPSQAHINYVSVINNKDSVIFRGNFANLKEEPVLSHKENDIRISFGNVNEVMSGVRYSTHLNKEPWSIPSTSISKEYNDLRGGKYHFEVKAISPDGSETIDSFTFRVLPPWWRSNWMFFVYALLLIFLLLIFVRYVQVRANKINKRLLHEKDMEMASQQQRHLKENEEKDRQIKELEREQLDIKLKHKTQEVANMMISLSHKNDALLNIRKELQNILRLVPKGNPEVRNAITELQQQVVVDVKSDDVLKKVEEEFDLVHNNFIMKLRERYPDLTHNEILLCAYLKISLSTKEIAPLLNISQRGVETMRYRLRKKLNLEREDSLSNFILKFN